MLQKSASIHVENSQQTRKRGNILFLIKVFIKKATVTLIPNSDWLNVFSLRSGAQQGCLFSSSLVEDFPRDSSQCKC